MGPFEDVSIVDAELAYPLRKYLHRLMDLHLVMAANGKTIGHCLVDNAVPPSAELDHLLRMMVYSLPDEFVLKSDCVFGLEPWESVWDVCSVERAYLYMASMTFLRPICNPYDRISPATEARGLITDQNPNSALWWIANAAGCADGGRVARAIWEGVWRRDRYWGRELQAVKRTIRWLGANDGRVLSNARRDLGSQLANDYLPIDQLYAVDNSAIRVDWNSITKNAGLTKRERTFVKDYLAQKANSKTDPAAWKAITGKNRNKRTRLAAQIRRHRIMPGALLEYPTNEKGERTGGPFFTHLRTSADDRFPYKEFYP